MVQQRLLRAITPHPYPHPRYQGMVNGCSANGLCTSTLPPTPPREPPTSGWGGVRSLRGNWFGSLAALGMRAGQGLGTWPWGSRQLKYASLARTWSSDCEHCALGPCPLLSEQRIFTWWRFTGTSIPDHDRTSRTKTPEGLQQLTSCLSHLSYKRALLKAFGEFPWWVSS